MLIVLDTNIMYADLRLSGPSFHTILSSRTGHVVCFPQVVLDEARGHFARNVRAHLAELQKLERLLGRPPTQMDGDAIAGAVTDYESHLKARLQPPTARVLPYPKTAHPELAARAIARKRPFKESGAGYRDALIWHSVLELLASTNDSALLVTNNSRDFSDGQGALHSDLVQDLKAHGIGPERVELFDSLEPVVAKHVRPALKRLDDIVAALSEGTWQGFDLHDWASDQLRNELVDRPTSVGEVGLAGDATEVVIIDVSEDHLDIEDAYALPDGDVVVKFTAYVECEVQFEVFADDWAVPPRRLRVRSPGVAFARLRAHKMVRVSGSVSLDEEGTPTGFQIGEPSPVYRK